MATYHGEPLDCRRGQAALPQAYGACGRLAEGEPGGDFRVAVNDQSDRICRAFCAFCTF